MPHNAADQRTEMTASVTGAEIHEVAALPRTARGLTRSNLVAADPCCTIPSMEAATIGQYRVTGVIGQGGMGAVYAAEHALLGRPAAIKVLLPELSQKQDIVQRFFNEARAATAIRHPGIVEIYDFGWTSDGAAFIVMERLDGETLARRAGRGRMRWQAAFGVARQIAGALAAAHGKGIVHRDLKPDNVFLVLDPEVPGGERIKLLDFGIAKLAGEASSMANATRTGQVMGTPTYMAPEQCRGVAVDHRVDLYALGCVVFELCSGRPPFIGEGTGDVLAAHIHVPPPRLAALGVDAPYAVEQLVQWMLAKSPADRVPTAEETIRAIDAITSEQAPATGLAAGVVRIATSSPSLTTLSGAASAAPPSAPEARGERRSIAIVAAVAAAITVVVVAVAMQRRGDAPVIEAPSGIANRAAGASPVPSPPPEPIASAAPAAGRGPEPADVAAAAPPPVAAPSAVVAPPAAGAASPATPPAAVVASRAAGAAGPATPPITAPSPAASPSASVELAVDSVPAGARVVLAGKLLGKTPYRATLPRGDAEVTLLVQLGGYLDKSLVVHPDHAIAERVQLVRQPRAPGPNRDQSVNPFAE